MHDTAVSEALEALDAALRRARDDLRSGLTAQEITGRFQSEIDLVSRRLVARDLDMIRADLDALGPVPLEPSPEGGFLLDEGSLNLLTRRDMSPLSAIVSIRELVRALDVDRSDEAQPVMPMATISVTEDMATAMRLHSQGWRSVYHDERLGWGLAPEDLGTAMKQRMRWAEGTLQVMLKENPGLVPGLSPGQRLMYLATMWSYLQGFAALAYLAAPVLYLGFGFTPVRALSAEFFWHLLPYLGINQVLFVVVGWGMATWRGQQYSLALFPVWIQATLRSTSSVILGRTLAFAVTPKTRQNNVHWRSVAPQLVAMVLLAAAVTVGLIRLALGLTQDGPGILVNAFWACYDLVVLSVVVDALLYNGPEEVKAPLAEDASPRELAPVG
jgi:cellulose synthase (UDP-forming)